MSTAIRVYQTIDAKVTVAYFIVVVAAVKIVGIDVSVVSVCRRVIGIFPYTPTEEFVISVTYR